MIGVARDVKQIERQSARESGGLCASSINSRRILRPRWLAISPTTMHVVVRTAMPVDEAGADNRARGQAGRAGRGGCGPSRHGRRLQRIDSASAAAGAAAEAFSALALLLEAMGTYGVLAFMVTARRREIGIRLALGAERGRVLRQVMVLGLTPAGIGVAGGLACALGVNRFLASLLFGIEPADATTLLIAVVTVLGIAALACWLPAWRASRVDRDHLARR